MGMMRRLVGSLLCIGGGACATAGWFKYDAIANRIGRAVQQFGVPHDDSTALAYVMMGGGALAALAGLYACVKKDK